MVHNAVGVERLLEGISAHRSFGARTDRLRASELARRGLIVLMFGLAVAVLAQLLSGGTLRIPW